MNSEELWQQEEYLYDLMFEDLEADSQNVTIEDDQEIDKIIDRLSIKKE